MCIYIYIYIEREREMISTSIIISSISNLVDTGVCETSTPPDRKTSWEISFENTTSLAGLQFLLLGRMAKAQDKGMLLFTDTDRGKRLHTSNRHLRNNI